MDNSGYFALAGVVLAFALTALKDYYYEKRRIIASKRQIAAALLAESVALRDRFIEIYTRPLQDWKPGQPLEVGGGARVTNLFAVYDGITDKLGLFEHEDSKAVVRAYTLAKAQVEVVIGVTEVRNFYLNQMSLDAATGSALEEHLRGQLQRYEDRLGPVLKKESTDAFHAWADAINVLEKYAGVKSD